MLQFISITWILLVLMLTVLLAATLATMPVSSVPAREVSSPFLYTFNTSGVLQEASSMDNSSSPYFWLNSGGTLEINNNTGSTFTGTAVKNDFWTSLYNTTSSVDTEGGEHPQNLFRLLTRSKWLNTRHQTHFLILNDNLADSPNRNGSNGLLHMVRYLDSDTLYYAGVRVDGTAVIKKKYKGTYYTMSQKAVFPGTYEGSQDDKNLLPHRAWLGLRTEVTNISNGVQIDLYVQKPGSSSWQKVLSATDTGQYGGTSPITSAGYAGVRTDFMDVRFENYRIENI